MIGFRTGLEKNDIFFCRKQDILEFIWNNSIEAEDRDIRNDNSILKFFQS